MVDVHMLIITYMLFIDCYDIHCACAMLRHILQGLQEAITCVIHGHHGTYMRQPRLFFVRPTNAALSF